MKTLKLTLRRQATTRYGVWGTTRRAYDECRYELIDGNGTQIHQFCAAQFHAATGFRLTPGTKKRVEIQIKAIA